MKDNPNSINTTALQNFEKKVAEKFNLSKRKDNLLPPTAKIDSRNAKEKGDSQLPRIKKSPSNL